MTARKPNPDEELARNAYAHSDPESLVPTSLANGLDASIERLRELVGSGLDDRSLIMLIAKDVYQRDLFAELVKLRRRSGTWPAFVHAFLDMPTEAWDNDGGDLDRDHIHLLTSAHCLLNPNTGVGRAVRKAITSSDHPLFEAFDLETYWMDQIRQFIGARNYKRAWEMIRQAYRGLPRTNLDPAEGPEDFDLNASNASSERRCCHVEIGVIRRLIEELFNAMLEARQVDAHPEPFGEAQRDNIDRASYEFAIAMSHTFSVKAYKIARSLYRKKQRTTQRAKSLKPRDHTSAKQRRSHRAA